MGYFRIPNFKAFQHYPDERGKDWIKVHTTYLDNYHFLILPVEDQRNLIMLWLLAAGTDNRIPDDPTFLRNCLSIKGDLDLSKLVEAGFLEPIEQESPDALPTR